MNSTLTCWLQLRQVVAMGLWLIIAAPAFAFGVPPNDECSDAIEHTLSPAEVFFSMAGATEDPDAYGVNEVWFRCTAPCTGTMTILVDNISPPVNTFIGVYSPNVLGGCTCPPGGGLFGGGQLIQSGSEFVTLPVSGGSCYLISVGGNPNTASASLRIEVVNTVNGDCVDALRIGTGITSYCVNDNTADAPPTPCGDISNDAWFEYLAGCTGTLTVSTCTNINVVRLLAVYGPGPAGFSCPGGAPPFHAVLLGCAASGNCPSQPATLTVPVAAGELYKIRVGTSSTVLEGYGTLTLSTTVANDSCTGAQVIRSGVTPFCTLMANEGGAEDSCTTFADPGPDIWFRHTAECTGTLVVSTCNQADFNTKLAIYEGCGVLPPFFFCNLNTLLACNDNDLFCPGGTSKLAVPVTQGMCYRIRLGAANNESGTGTLTLSYVGCTPPDPCPADIAPPGGDGSVNIDDLTAIILAWGTNDPTADIDNDGSVEIDDLTAVILAWGPCA